MHFKIDENLPPLVAELLREAGHDVRTVYDQGLRSCADPQLLRACQTEGRALLSLDLDFSNILVYPPEHYAGLIVLRPRKPGAHAVATLVRRLLPQVGKIAVAGRLWIVDEKRIRVRLIGEINLGPEVRDLPIE